MSAKKKAMQPDDIDMQEAAEAHQQELEARRWQEELTADAGYFEWLDQLRQEVNYGDHCD